MKLYKDDKIAFNQYITQHIDNHQIVFQLQALVREHHLLDVRSEIINEALNIYENGAKIMFANAVPTIIEGVFHDLCIEIGEDENELLQQGFQYKLDKLKDTLSYELYYEYYAFKFRLFRNKVAHGRLTVDDVNELSDLLLLDLFQVCKLVSSTKLPLTQKRFLIDTITSEEDKSANYEKVLEYLILDDIEIPDFYNLEAQILEVEDVIASDKFWEYLDAQITDTNEVTRHGIAGILAIIKKKGAYDDKCNSLFKKLRIGKVKKSLKDSYFKRLRNYY